MRATTPVQWAGLLLLTQVHLDGVAANQAAAIFLTDPLTWFTHRRGGITGEALRAQRLVRTSLVIPERSTELVITALEPQLLPEITILVFKLRGGLLQVSHSVQYFVDLLLRFAVF
jgi:hypothetical protein